MNLNYPDYTQSFGGYGTYGMPLYPKAPDYGPGIVSGATEGIAGGSSFGPVGALVGGLAGTVLGAYGTYQQGKQADQDYQAQIAAWEADQARQKRMDEDSRRQQARQKAMSAGSYAQGLESSLYGTYAPWARRVGL